MSIETGRKLGPYEVVAPIASGGMGEVYKARDTRLERTVAVKVLPEHLSSRPELRERFEREARAVSALNHPNICILHDVGCDGETDYLVMEYLEGETLAERLKRGTNDPSSQQLTADPPTGSASSSTAMWTRRRRQSSTSCSTGSPS